MKFYAGLVGVALLAGCGASSNNEPLAKATGTYPDGGHSGSSTSGNNDASAPSNKDSGIVGTAGSDGSAAKGPGTDGAPGSSTITVLVTPSSTKIGPGREATFIANVTGTTNMGVTWSVMEGAAGGTVDNGTYTAPMTTGTYHVVAQSQADSNATSVATVTVSSVGGCTALPAAGTWDTASIAPVVFPDPQNDYFTGKSCSVVVDPFDPATVWLGTGNKGLFKSTDCGSTWTHVNSGTNGDKIDQSTLWSMAFDPVNQGVIYTVVAYGAGGLYKSTNGGVDWVQLDTAGSPLDNAMPSLGIGNVAMDPTNPLHLVAGSHETCNSPFTSGCIAETFDGGMTWPNIQQMPASWAEDGGVYVINATTWVWGSAESEDGTWVSTNNGKTWTQALPALAGDGVGEFSILPLAPAKDGAYYLPSLQGAIRSTDGINWSLIWSPQQMTPQIVGMAVSSTTIYGSQGQTFYSAPLSNYKNWSSMPAPPYDSNGFAGFLAYSETYHLLYASTWADGVFRYVASN